MKSILILGAGQSSPHLIHYLLGQASQADWIVTVADRDPDLAAERVGGHPRGEAVALDVGDRKRLDTAIEKADAVVCLLPPDLQTTIAHFCVQRGRPMISAAYSNPEIRALSAEARQRGILLLMEIGLDPGIDHMASMSLIDRIHDEGGIVEHFESYGSGVPAPDSVNNPLRYAITWDPRGVVRAGEAGAHYLRNGRLRVVPRQRVFAQTWPVQIEGVGAMEAYPNRDSLVYRELFGLAQARTLIRGTLRYPGWCATWHQIVRLGLTTERISIPRLAERSFAELVEMFLPESSAGLAVEEQAATTLGLDRGGAIMANLRWLGLFSDEPIGIDATTATDALVGLLRRKLLLPPNGRDMVVLHHILEARFPGGRNDVTDRRRVIATLVQLGEPGGMTAMARSVGLPAAIATRLVLEGRLDLAGCHIPTEPAIYQPVLAALASEGLQFHERTLSIDVDP